jgi:hypothetical protein
MAKQLKSVAEFGFGQLRSVEFLRSLVNEIVIVSWVLIVIFWLARWQGIADARRDAGQNSTLICIDTPLPKGCCWRIGDKTLILPKILVETFRRNVSTIV